MHRFRVISKIGNGSFGDVFLVKRKTDNKVLALKRLIAEPGTSNFEREKRYMEREISLL